MKYASLLLALLLGCGSGGGSEQIASDPFCEQLIDNVQPIGVSFIHGLQAEAKPQVDALKQILLKSCVKRIAANFLVDGSFGLDTQVLSDFVTDMSVFGREVHLILYLQNGSSQRRWKNTAVKGFASNIEPSRFRDMIMHDAAIRERYRAIVRSLLPVIDQAHLSGGTIYLVVGLEDNLTSRQALEVKHIGTEALEGRFVLWVRNPCPGCYAGNDESSEGFDMRERHAQNTAFATSNGIITNDGFNLSFDELSQLKQAAFARDNVFIAWDRARQGIPPSGEYLAPNKRLYYIPTQGEFDDLIAFLRK